MKYTIKEFQSDFPNDNACLEYIFNKRFGKDHTCPECGKKGFYRVSNRKCYACAWCSYQIHPLAGTIFHKSATSLKDWFFAIFLMSQSKNGVSAKEIERHLGVTYKTAWRIQKQIRKLMKQGTSLLSGTIEVDETYMGGRKKKHIRGRGPVGKTAVAGILQRNGKLKTKVLGTATSSSLVPFIRNNVAIGSELMTDEYNIYRNPNLDVYKRGTIHHEFKEFVKGNIHVNTIEGFWSQLKRSIHGTYHQVSKKYLQQYVNEFSYRYDRRDSETHLFQHLLSEVVE